MSDDLNRNQSQGLDQVVVWMNQPSHYQTVFFQELASRPGLALTVCYATGIPADRKALGWQEPAPEAYAQKVLAGWRDGLALAWQHRSAVHLVNGVWSVRVFVLCSLLLVLGGAPVYFHSERPNPGGARGGVWDWLKRSWVKLLFIRAKGIFVIGRRAGDYYRSLGVPTVKIFPFMYFNRGAGARPGGHRSDRAFTVIYVGQFVPRKRVGDLIEAFARLRAGQPAARLKLVGAGVLRTAYLEKISAAQLTGCVEVAGPLTPQDVTAAIQDSDVLVLPSDFDGWGLTVNEALQAGVPAICSDACGAAELLEEHPEWGLVFPTGDVAALAAALQKVASSPRQFHLQLTAVEAVIGPAAQTARFLQVVMDTGLRPGKASNHGF